MGVFEQLGISAEDMKEPKLEVRNGKYVLSGVYQLSSFQWRQVKAWIEAGRPFVNQNKNY